ncbi:hypothetical protein [Filimonas effusa]|uniref:Uncharacterized protein n=1 Tax=Filimonas effusa TaxID=2508721 RepID=A0A4V1M9F9_9BACT|nr:hypothetical protein [Filimonas effusa]RXK80962.1 hypothetical protein ESB13_22680 [Filimonas effusa]
MKRTAAFILTLVYLAFAFGGLVHEPTAMAAVYSQETDDAGKPDAKAEEKSFENASITFKKGHKHLAPVSKVKLPRPALPLTSYTSFISEYHSNANVHPLRTGTPLWSSATLYLRNCTFLI